MTIHLASKKIHCHTCLGGLQPGQELLENNAGWLGPRGVGWGPAKNPLPCVERPTKEQIKGGFGAGKVLTGRTPPLGGWFGFRVFKPIFCEFEWGFVFFLAPRAFRHQKKISKTPKPILSQISHGQQNVFACAPLE